MPKPAKRKMKPEVREIVDWAEPHGWVLDDRPDGSDHWVLRHPSGETVRLPATPSEYRGTANAKAKIRRISGLPSESGPAAKYRHESYRRPRFDMDAAVRDLRDREAERAEAEQQEAERLAEMKRVKAEHDAALADLKAIDPRRQPGLARLVARKVVALKAHLKNL